MIFQIRNIMTCSELYNDESGLIFQLLPFAPFRQLLLHTTSSLQIISYKRELYASDEGKYM